MARKQSNSAKFASSNYIQMTKTFCFVSVAFQNDVIAYGCKAQ